MRRCGTVILLAVSACVPSASIPNAQKVTAKVGAIVAAALSDSTFWRSSEVEVIADTVQLRSVAGLTNAEFRMLSTELAGSRVSLGHNCPNDRRDSCVILSLLSYRREGGDVVLRLMWARAVRCGGDYSLLFRVRIAGDRAHVIDTGEKVLGECVRPDSGWNP